MLLDAQACMRAEQRRWSANKNKSFIAVPTNLAVVQDGTVRIPSSSSGSSVISFPPIMIWFSLGASLKAKCIPNDAARRSRFCVAIALCWSSIKVRSDNNCELLDVNKSDVKTGQLMTSQHQISGQRYLEPVCKTGLLPFWSVRSVCWGMWIYPSRSIYTME